MTTELSLTVKSIKLGSVETNIDELEKFVAERIKDYSPENFKDADTAKKARAEMNKAADQIAATRKNLMSEAMKPYSELEDRLKSLEKQMKTGSGLLDDIVKAKENEEKEAKKAEIKSLWDSKNYPLVTFEQIFDSRWTNKTAKIGDVEKEIDSIINKCSSDIKVLEGMDDAEQLKAIYLESLDLSAALARAEQLKANRERAKQEAEQREARNHNVQIQEQKKDIAQEQKNLASDHIADEALEQKPELGTMTLEFKGTLAQFIGLKNYLTQQGITYRKVQSGTGAYL